MVLVAHDGHLLYLLTARYSRVADSCRRSRRRRPGDALAVFVNPFYSLREWGHCRYSSYNMAEPQPGSRHYANGTSSSHHTPRHQPVHAMSTLCTPRSCQDRLTPCVWEVRISRPVAGSQCIGRTCIICVKRPAHSPRKHAARPIRTVASSSIRPAVVVFYSNSR